MLIILIIDLELEFLLCLENVVDHKGLLEVGVEVVVNGLSTPQKAPLICIGSFEEHSDVGIRLRKHVHVVESPGRQKYLQLHRFLSRQHGSARVTLHFVPNKL